MDGLAWIELFSSFTDVFQLLNPVKWWNKLSYCWNYYYRTPYRILVFGTSGAGKTEFLRSLLEEPISETAPQRTQGKSNKKLVFPDGRKIRFIDLPGHSLYRHNRRLAVDEIAKRKINGIINVVTYGYNNVEQNEIDNVFTSDGSSVVRENYLKTNRMAELVQIGEWNDAIHNNCGVKTVVTVVTKADLWKDNDVEVMKYYSEGEYFDKCIKPIERVVHTCVFPYCSIISLFGDRPMTLSFDERDKQRLHREFKDELLNIIRHDS